MTHTLKIRGGPGAGTITLELDGKPLKGVRGYAIAHHIEDQPLAVVRLDLLAELDVEIEVEEENLDPKDDTPAGTCALCGLPMPEGEEMFKYHGYSGPCPTQGGAS